VKRKKRLWGSSIALKEGKENGLDVGGDCRTVAEGRIRSAEEKSGKKSTCFALSCLEEKKRIIKRRGEKKILRTLFLQKKDVELIQSKEKGKKRKKKKKEQTSIPLGREKYSREGKIFSRGGVLLIRILRKRKKLSLKGVAIVGGP